MCIRYKDFFNTDKTEQQLLYQLADHAIELKSGSESLYIHIYNMLSAELKTLDKYLTKALAKK